MERTFKRDLCSLSEIFSFLREFKRKSKIENSVAFGLNLIVEELFTNMVKYNAENPNDIQISLEKSGDRLILVFNDFDVEPFDITKVNEVDTRQCLEEREVGGLGIHLVKCIADEVDYEYSDRRSKITVVKKLDG